RMAFAALAAEESFETSDEDAVLTTIQIENGAFYADGSPVFLAGMILGENELAQVERLARYGLNLAVVERPHTALRPALDQVRDELTPVFDAAKRHNTSVAVQLFMPPDDGGALGANVRPSAVFRLSEPTTRAYSVYLAGRPYAHSLILDTRPRFLFGGESVVESFRRAVERDYLERFALNRHWRTRLASFEDIDIWRGYKRPAYQFDWQVLHRRLGTRHFNRLREAAAEEAPTLLTQVALAGDILTPGESQYAIGHEELARAFPVSGLSAHGSPYGGSYGIEEPGERMLYTLARSFAPGNPVFNSALAPTGNRAIHEPFLFEFIHARVWEGAIEGLSAIALAVPDPRNSGRPSYLDQPEALEGFATANLDINRLLDIVVAFQNAPAKLAILWSGSSKIYEDGEAFLASAANAYSGVSASGLKVRFITETQCRNGELAGIHLLVIPNTPANDDEAMAAIKAYVERGGSIIRAAKPMPYSEKGESRTQELRFGEDTLLVRGTGLASEYLSAMDAALSQGFIVSRPRAINEFGYPLEGVRTRYVEVDGVRYLYVINLRTAPVFAHLFGPFSGGSDLIRGGRISFPGTLQPMRPLLLRLDAPADDAGVELLEVSPPEMNTGREGSSDFARRVEVKPLGANP
ncbi:MAG: hypothetical protein QGG73_05290, partial [Candidatus Hydrogenedentes bacterium]|nr:hypothetical protein [Candidatus Hydrogenedentota bacterium]